MPYLFNGFYLLALVCLSPWLLFKMFAARKYRRGILSKLLGNSPQRHRRASCAWFHGVSVGEIHLLRPLVAAFRRQHPDWDCVISTTTDTGYDEACKRFPDLSVFYWPLDFSWAVRRALRRVNPSLVVLAESELWPNFLMAARRRGVPVAVVNGRMSPRSFTRWKQLFQPPSSGKQAFLWTPLARLLRPILRRILGQVALWAVQTEEYAACYRILGLAPERVAVTGSIKYDGVNGDRENAQTQSLRRLFAIAGNDLVWIAGSTQDPEERITLDIYRRVKELQPSLRLFIVPRQKDRFEEVAQMLRKSRLPFVRRSQMLGPLEDRTAIVLVDSMGELSALWGLADVAFVGGSLDGKRGGQNMIEPASYGAAVLFGPHVWNFRDTADRLVEAGGAITITDAAALEIAMRQLLRDASTRARLGDAARRFVTLQYGATQRTVDLLDHLLHGSGASSARAA